jgi:gliding motility-associated-like protein
LVTTFAGSTANGWRDGAGTSALFNYPGGIAIDAAGNLYVADSENDLIRKITPAALVTTLAGNGTRGSFDGPGKSASFNHPYGLATDLVGNVYVADEQNMLIRKITPNGTVSTIAGNGPGGSIDGIGRNARFSVPTSITCDGNSFLYVGDIGTSDIRKISITGYTIDKDLPAGLLFDPTTGTISGTPTVTSPLTDYTVTAYNSSGSSSTTIRIEVDGITPVITTSTVTGDIAGCVGSSGNGSVGQFTVAGTSLSGDITITAPAGFYISLNAASGYASTLTLKENNNTVINTTVHISPAASDPAGPISGDIQISTPGTTPITIPVTGTVNALPTVDQLQNISYNTGATTVPVNFTGTANTFTWTNNNPSIGLPASGTGNIAAFTAVNTGNAPVSATIIVTPVNNTTGCPGTPATFTITVNSLSPSITANTASGTISACAGSASESPNIEQFTVSGGNLTGDITATAPAGFEISLSQTTGFGNTLTIPQSAGTVSNITVYVRSAGPDPAGSISGNVVLTSQGAASQNVTVSGTVNELPAVNIVPRQTVNNGAATTAINFTGTAGTYTWTNNTPGIGLPASGTGNIPSFNAIDVDGDTPVTATIIVTPGNSATGCNGTPVSFTITVDPVPPPVLTTSATLTGLSTIYGTASPSESFTVSATNATAGILVTAPQGFEVSTDNQTFGNTVTVGQAGTIGTTTVYFRLAATAHAGLYSGSITVSTPGTDDVNINIPESIVDRAVLTISAPDVTRVYGVPNPVFVPSYQGFVNGDDQTSLLTLPELTTTATISSPEGKYPIQVSGGSSPNYTINTVDGTLTIVPSADEIIIPNAFTPNGDGINDLWNIKKLTDFPQCLVSVYSRYGSLVFQSRGYFKPWDGTQNGSPVPTGTYYFIINPNAAGLPLLSGYVTVLR